jgi:GTP-binding protein Era
LALPSAGESTLVNLLVGEKVSIVSAKPQTTRSVVLGIAHHGGMESVLVDLPGFTGQPQGGGRKSCAAPGQRG